MSFRLGVLVAGLILISSCDDPDADNAAETLKGQTNVAAPDTSHQVRPEAMVTFPKGGIACLDKDDLQKAIEYGVSGRETKMQSLFVDHGGDCVILSSAETFRVIDSEYNDPALPDAGVLEIVGKSVHAAEHGAFTLVMDPSMVRVLNAPTKRH